MDRPNIVFIMIDDLGWRDTGCFGSTFYETPNIDKLSEEGMRFTNAYAAAPICSPTRASLFSGKYPARLGLTNWIGAQQLHGRSICAPNGTCLPLEEYSLAKAFKEGGYATYHVGKWHLGPEEFFPEHHGFDNNIGGCHWGSPKHGYFSPYNNPKLKDGPKGEYLTDRLTSDAIQLIKQSQDKPFFLHLAYYSVHTPIQCPSEEEKYFKEKAKRLGLDKAVISEAGERVPISEHRKDRVVRRLIQSDSKYAGMIKRLDMNIGRVLKVLDELNLRDNTIVVFYSDNGGLATCRQLPPTSNVPLRDGKAWMYEGGLRVNLIISWPPKIGQNIVSEIPLNTPDFYPTLLELANLPSRPDQHVDGVSFASVLRGNSEKDLEQRPLFFHFPHYHSCGSRPFSSVICDQFKLIEFLDSGNVELYDLRTDISEERDLALELPTKAANLLDTLQKWRQKVDAKLPTPNPLWPQCLYEDFLALSHPLVLNDENEACLEMPISPDNPTLYTIPLTEFLEDYYGMKASLELQSKKFWGTFTTNKESHVMWKTNDEPPQRISEMLTEMIGKQVFVRIWSEKPGDMQERTAYIQIKEGFDPFL